MHADTTQIDPRSSPALIDDADGRSRHFRRFKEILATVAGQVGGADGLSPAQAITLRNAAALQLRAEQLQGALGRVLINPIR